MKELLEKFTPKIIILVIGGLIFLTISISVGTYFLYIVPKQQDERLAFERKKYEDEQAEKEAIKKAEQDKILAQQLAEKEQKDNLDLCLAKTNLTYLENWISYCKLWKTEVKDTYEDCKKDNSFLGVQGAKDYCWTHTPDYKKDGEESCFLPKKYSEKVDLLQSDAKGDCYVKYPSLIGQ